MTLELYDKFCIERPNLPAIIPTASTCRTGKDIFLSKSSAEGRRELRIWKLNFVR